MTRRGSDLLPFPYYDPCFLLGARWHEHSDSSIFLVYRQLRR